MNPNLFKSAEFYQRRYKNFSTLFIIPLMLLASFLLMFSLFAKKEITITSKGEITPKKVIAFIQSTSNNPITTNKLSNNKLVKKNEVIIQFSETMEISQKQALETQLASLNRQKIGLETLKVSLSQNKNFFSGEDEFGYINTFNNFITQSQEIELGISKINNEVNRQATLSSNTITAIDTQINQIYHQITEYKELRQAISDKHSRLSAGNPHQVTLNNYLSQYQQQSQPELAVQYLSQINQSISGLESSIASLNIQRAGTGSVATYDNSLETKIETLRTQFLQSASQQLATINTQITELSSQLKQATVKLKNNTITAPESGIIHLNSEFEGKS